MQVRLPWILSRRRLLTAIFVDCILFAAFYNGLYIYRFGEWPNWSLALLVVWFIWVLASYVLGRYQGIQAIRDPAGVSILQGVIQTILALAISFSGILTYLWLFESSVGNLFTLNYLIPCLILLGVFSLIAQMLLGLWIRTRPLDIDHWSFIGNLETFQRLQHHLQWSLASKHRLFINLTA